MKKILSITLVLILMMLSFSFAVNAETSFVNVRIEGVDDTLFEGDIAMELTESSTVCDVLEKLNDANDNVSILGLTGGYITEVNGIKSSAFGGWDGWLYSVNGTSPDVGITDYRVKRGDNIVLYYGDYPCQLPKMNTVQAYKGVLVFESYDTTYDENWNPTSQWMPVTGADVKVGDNTYTTDENGAVKLNTSDLTSFNLVQINKKSSTGAPAVCRFSKDTGFYYNDINGDNIVNINDVTALQKHLAGIEIKVDLSCCDINLDGEIDINDATALQKIILEAAI